MSNTTTTPVVDKQALLSSIKDKTKAIVKNQIVKK